MIIGEMSYNLNLSLSDSDMSETSLPHHVCNISSIGICSRVCISSLPHYLQNAFPFTLELITMRFTREYLHEAGECQSITLYSDVPAKKVKLIFY